MNARPYLLAGTVLGAALIGAPSVAFVAYSAGYQAGTEAPTAASAPTRPQSPATTGGLCSIPHISAVCDVDPAPAASLPATPLRPVATTGLCSIPNISSLCPVQ